MVLIPLIKWISDGSVSHTSSPFCCALVVIMCEQAINKIISIDEMAVWRWSPIHDNCWILYNSLILQTLIARTKLSKIPIVNKLSRISHTQLDLNSLSSADNMRHSWVFRLTFILNFENIWKRFEPVYSVRLLCCLQLMPAHWCHSMISKRCSLFSPYQ